LEIDPRNKIFPTVCTIPVWPFVVADGPYLETREHIGGFWILDAANMDDAVV
jgi:hypothetical protein